MSTVLAILSYFIISVLMRVSVKRGKYETARNKRTYNIHVYKWHEYSKNQNNLCPYF